MINTSSILSSFFYYIWKDFPHVAEYVIVWGFCWCNELVVYKSRWMQITFCLVAWFLEIWVQLIFCHLVIEIKILMADLTGLKLWWWIGVHVEGFWRIIFMDLFKRFFMALIETFWGMFFATSDFSSEVFGKLQTLHFLLNFYASKHYFILRYQSKKLAHLLSLKEQSIKSKYSITNCVIAANL